MIPGMDTWRICSQRLAPSTIAASYSSGLMPASAAMKMIDPQPAFCHMPEEMYIGRNQRGSTMNGIDSPPKTLSTALTIPSEASTLTIIPQTTTVEMK